MHAQPVIGGLVANAFPLVGWIIAVILAVIMLRRGGGRAERFLLAGASLRLVTCLIGIPMPALAPWLVGEKGMVNLETVSILSVFSLVSSLTGLAGIICLVYAFWVKFKRGETPNRLK